MIPIEVKASFSLVNMDLNPLEAFIKKYKIPLGLVIYGGSPHLDSTKKILYWPFWLL